MTDRSRKKLPSFQILTHLPPPSWDSPSEWKLAEPGVGSKIHDHLTLTGAHKDGLEGLLPGSEILLYHEKVHEPLRNDLTLVFKAGQDFFFGIHRFRSGKYHIPSSLSIWYLPDRNMGRVLRRFQRMAIPGEDHFSRRAKLFHIEHMAGEDVPESYFED